MIVKFACRDFYNSSEFPVTAYTYTSAPLHYTAWSDYDNPSGFGIIAQQGVGGMGGMMPFARMLLLLTMGFLQISVCAGMSTREAGSDAYDSAISA